MNSRIKIFIDGWTLKVNNIKKKKKIDKKVKGKKKFLNAKRNY